MGRDLTKLLNLNRSFGGLNEIVATRKQELKERRTKAAADLFTMIDVSRLPPEALITGIVVGPNDRHLLR